MYVYVLKYMKYIYNIALVHKVYTVYKYVCVYSAVKCERLFSKTRLRMTVSLYTGNAVMASG